jgi:C_GCAxxG_C_C family probable redox protein
VDRVEKSVANFNEGLNCAQAVLASYGPAFGLSKATAKGVAAPFGGGLARTGGTCGVVTGASMVLGLLSQTKGLSDTEAKEYAYRLAKEFFQRFLTRHTSIICRDLINCDLSTPEGQKQAKDQKLHVTFCTGFVRAAAEILEDMIREETGPAAAEPC